MKIQANRLCKKFNSLTKEEREFAQGIILYHRRVHHESEIELYKFDTFYTVNNCIQTYAAGRLSKHPAFIGNGAFSAVFKHPSDPNKVIKIQISQEDESAQYYEVACKLNDPNFIKVHTMDHCLGHNVFVLERVSALDEYTRDAISECEWRGWNAKRLMRRFNEGYCQVTPYIRAALRVRNRIQKYFKKFTLDLHTGNWGLRNDGTLVVLDPIC